MATNIIQIPYKYQILDNFIGFIAAFRFAEALYGLVFGKTCSSK